MLLGCGAQDPQAAKPTPSPPAAAAPCAAAAADRLFDALGPDETGLHWDFVEASPPGDHFVRSYGGGLVAADFNGDGLVDLWVANKGAAPSLFLNRGRMKFDEVDAGEQPDRYTIGGSAADYDADGDADLLAFVETGPRLLRNDGAGRFEDVTDVSGLAIVERPIAAAWADQDADGWLDLYVCTTFGAREGATDLPTPDWLYYGGPDGRFTAAGPRAPALAESSGCFAGGFADLDGDGLPELVTVHAEKGLAQARDHVLLGADPTVDLAAAWGMDQHRHGMGLVLADLSGHAARGAPALDVFKASYPDDYFFRASADGFVEATAAAGLVEDPPRVWTPWNAESWDVDQDGDPDLAVQLSRYEADADAGDIDDGAYMQFYFNDGAGHFEFVHSDELGIPRADVTRSFVKADFDRDGAVDLVVPSVPWSSQSARSQLTVLRGRCTEGGSLRVVPRGPGGRGEVPGATIRLEAGGLVQQATTVLGGQPQSSEPAVAHFGLGGAAIVDRLTVTFPSGGVVELDDLLPGEEVIVDDPVER